MWSTIKKHLKERKQKEIKARRNENKKKWKWEEIKTGRNKNEKKCKHEEMKNHKGSPKNKTGVFLTLRSKGLVS